MSDSVVRIRLQDSRVRPFDFRVDPKKHGVERSIALYRASGVWEYLQELATRGKILLEEGGVTCFEDILERAYHGVIAVNVKVAFSGYPASGNMYAGEEGNARE